MSRAELWNWTLTRDWGPRQKSRLLRALKTYSIQHSNIEICEYWAKVMHERQLIGEPMSTTDAWVAATALFLNVPLITHNEKDFRNIKGLTVISESDNHS